MGASFAIALYVFFQLPAAGVLRDWIYTWIESGSFKIAFSLQVDALTAVMLLIVTGIGFLIHVYSLGYMAHDDGMARFFVYLNLFIFFMLLLIMADNLLLLFVGWEGVGLCSYLLIGFWYEDHNNTIAGNKAFIVNRIGDFGFILGILLLVAELGRQGVWTLDFAELQKHAQMMNPATVGLITLLLFVGAAGKSAQIPLFVWLPDAMAGPTPVSALIHAATMVTAGVYMTARLHFLFALAPATLALIAVDRRGDGVFRRDHRAHAKRHQKSFGLLDREPARLHVSGRGSRSVQRGDLSCFHPCVFQGLPVSRLG